MIGETFGNYRLVRRLGSGTMGTVYLGEHERIVRRAAVKILAPELALAGDLLDRFFEEARATSLIDHPVIVEVLDCGVHPDGRRPYIVMHYLEGETLAARLARQGPLGWREACDIARQMAEGLAAAHGHGIVHRDVKPANVMLLGAGPPAVKLLDFGVAKLLHDAQSKARTCPGSLLGTPEYMAPEQCGGEGTIDGRTDIYALGCVLFQMVCGRLPFQDEMTTDLLVAHRWREAPAASSVVQLPRALDRLIARMLAKRPEDRPLDMPRVAATLAELLASVAETARGPAPRAPRPARRLPVPDRSATILATVAFLSLLAIGARLGHGRRPSPPPASSARLEVTERVRMEAPPAVAPGGAAMQSTPAVSPPAHDTAAPAGPVAPRGSRRPAAERRPRPVPARDIDTDGIVHL